MHSTNHDRVVGTAIEWGNIISSKFGGALLSHPEQVAEVARQGNGILTRAIIGGLNDDGTLILLQTIVKYEGGVLSSPSAETTQITHCDKSYCAIGEVEVEQEFVNLTSERAKKEAKKWKPPKNSKPADYDILRAMRLVDLTIQYHGNDVGGPIDAVEMDKDGSVRWFAIKENCQKD